LTRAKVFISRQLKRSPRIFDIARKITRALGDRSPLYNALGAELALARNVRFIQIGANDGISVDPLREFITAAPSKYEGVFVEPVPNIFHKLQENYSYVAHGRLIFINAAVSSESGTKLIWKIKDSDLWRFPPFAYQISSFDREHLIRHFPSMKHVERSLESVAVPCRTLLEIQKYTGLDNLDLIHLDVEGHEPDILLNIDFYTTTPQILLFEISHMASADKGPVYRRLQEANYQLQEFGADCLALRNGNRRNHFMVNGH
jgi:FkbM family methyltransferase